MARSAADLNFAVLKRLDPAVEEVRAGGREIGRRSEGRERRTLVCFLGVGLISHPRGARAFREQGQAGCNMSLLRPSFVVVVVLCWEGSRKKRVDSFIGLFGRARIPLCFGGTWRRERIQASAL